MTTLKDRFLGRIPSNKERQRKVAKKLTGFDDSWYDKRMKKSLEKTYDTCHWCQAQLHPIDMINKKGKIVMTCNTPGCPGNYALDKKDWDRKYRKNKRFGRLVDGRLYWDFMQMVVGKHPDKLWSNHKRFI